MQSTDIYSTTAAKYMPSVSSGMAGVKSVSVVPVLAIGTKWTFSGHRTCEGSLTKKRYSVNTRVWQEETSPPLTPLKKLNSNFTI